MIIELNPFKWKKKTAAAPLPQLAHLCGRPSDPNWKAFPVPPADIPVPRAPVPPQPRIQAKAATPPASKPAQAEESVMSFTSVMKAIGQDAQKGLSFVVKYIVPVSGLVSLIFPASTAAVTEATTATALIQKAVVAVEQKYAASGVSTGTGAQKLAEVLTLTEDAVTDLLKQAGISADTDYVTKLVNAVVAILNVQQATTVAA